MITSIPDNQICEAFDPLMQFPEKTKSIIKDPMKANTSCVAPAYVYIEGSRGKRFLCDYHYYCEKNMTLSRTPEQWPLIEKYLVEKLEDVALTFSKDKTDKIKDTNLCWCTKKATTASIPKSSPKGSEHFLYHCNFHYRKIYFRFLSNNVDYDNLFNIIDERYKMNVSIKEEMKQLTII